MSALPAPASSTLVHGVQGHRKQTLSLESRLCPLRSAQGRPIRAQEHVTVWTPVQKQIHDEAKRMNKEIRGLQPVFDEWEIRVKSGDSECIAAFQVQTEALLLPVHHQQPIHERSVSNSCVCWATWSASS